MLVCVIIFGRAHKGKRIAVCIYYFQLLRSAKFENIHLINKRAAPEKMCLYKHSIQLFKLYNSTQQSTEWLHLNLQQNFNSRVNKFLISNYGQFKIGKNIMTNRLTCINNKVELNWLNLSLVAFKLKCKALFLS